MPAYARPAGEALALTFTREGLEPERLIAPDGYRAVSTAMRLLAKQDRLFPGDKLTVEPADTPPPDPFLA
jgi:hypothetical protein